MLTCLDLRQKYPQSTLLLCVGGLLIALTTEEKCGQLTEGLFGDLPRSGVQILSREGSAVCHSGHISRLQPREQKVIISSILQIPMLTLSWVLDSAGYG